MKFENPIMNISMFEVENVVTGSGDGQQNYEAAKTEVANRVKSNADAVQIVLAFE